MSVNAEQLRPNVETRNFEQHVRNLPTVYLILINPLAFCQNLMNFSLHQVIKRSQNKPHSLLEAKHPDLVILSNTELHLPRVSFEISHCH